MIRNFTIFLVISALMAITSCDDIIEPKLTGKTVSILAPSDGATLSATSVTFWWNQVKGASKYDVQIVKPSFSNIQYLIADSMVTGDKFTFDFQPGTYQWRIKAVNNSTQTDFFTFSFTIDSSLNLSNQSIQNLAPINNYISNELNQTFSWSPVFYAGDYRFEILSSGGNTVYVNAALPQTSVTYTFSAEGTYTWRVRAQNNSSVSLYSQSIILIDQTSPAVPIPLSPADNAIVSNPFTMSWSQAMDNGSAIFDSLYIFANSNQDTLIKAVRPSTPSFTDSFPHGDFYWKLRALDSAGNYSSYTSLYKFVVQ